MSELNFYLSWTIGHRFGRTLVITKNVLSNASLKGEKKIVLTS